MNRRIAIQVVSLVVAIGVGVLVGRLLRPDNARELALAKRAYDYCGSVHASLDLDARALGNAKDPAKQREAADRFMSATTYHSDYEILMCSKVAPNLSAHTACWLNYDYPCLEKLAAAAAAATKQ
jgi:hypothetical protein